MIVTIRNAAQRPITDIDIEWPTGWPLPRIGEYIQLPDWSSATVVDVAWFLPSDDGQQRPAIMVKVR